MRLPAANINMIISKARNKRNEAQRTDKKDDEEHIFESDEIM